MRTYLTLFVTALFFALGMTPFVRRWAMDWGAVDWPDKKRRIHNRPTPRLGGMAIFFAFFATLICAPLVGTPVSQSLRQNQAQVLGLLAPATLVFLLGVYDDFRGANSTLKLTVQLIASMMLYLSGFGITSISLPFDGSWEPPAMLSFPLTACWIVVITNAFNLIDGLDGLASGASVFALLSIFICSLSQGNPEISLMSIALVGSVMGFLRYNFNPATIFLGDSGSLFLGFMAAALSLAGAQKGSTIVAISIPLVSFGLPISEVGISVARRYIGGEPLFQSDRRHIHHMLLRRGLNHRQAVILLYAVCALFALFGLMLLNPERNRTALIFFVLGIGIILGVQHLRYAEFHALKYKITKGVARGRQALAVDVQIRLGSAELRLAQNIDQLLTALSDLFQASDLDSVALEVVETMSTQARKGAHATSANPEKWQWRWTREDIVFEDVLASNRFWALRVPLSAEGGDLLGSIVFYRDLAKGAITMDLTQVCGLLRQELSIALERLQRKNQKVFEAASVRAMRADRCDNFQFSALESDN